MITLFLYKHLCTGTVCILEQAQFLPMGNYQLRPVGGSMYIQNVTLVFRWQEEAELSGG